MTCVFVWVLQGEILFMCQQEAFENERQRKTGVTVRSREKLFEKITMVEPVEDKESSKQNV